MFRPGLGKNIVLLGLGALVLAGSMGPSCVIVPVVPAIVPVVPVEPEPVTIEFTNLTIQHVQPYLWADPGTIDTPDLVMVPVNAVDLGAAMDPSETFAFELTCEEAGTLVVDGALLTDEGVLLSFNTPLLQEGFDYLCGDIVSFYYEEDVDFFTSADVNDVTIIP